MTGPDEGLSWVREAEALIAGLRSVRGVQMTVEPSTGEITEVHAISTGERTPKQIVRDIRTALIAGLKIDVDYKKISIVERRADPAGEETAQIIDLVPELERAAAPRRVRVRGIGLTQSSLRCAVRVELSLGDREVVGEAEGPAGRHQVPRLTAEATLRGLERFVTEEYQLSLNHLEVLTLGGDTIVVATVKFTGERRQQTLSGSCVVDHDLQHAVAYATLAALNRILGRLPVKESVEYELRPTSIRTSPDWHGR